MQSLNKAYSPGYLPISDSHDAFFNNWATQMAISEASRRLSRGSNGQRVGSAMRISKPSSTSNSPRGSMVPGRRPQALEQRSIQLQSNNNRPARPVSWHPSSHFYTPQQEHHQQPQACYPYTTPNNYPHHQDMYSAYPHLSPMMASYSTNTSPSSTFSPLPVSFQPTAPHYLTPGGWDMSQKHAAYFPPVDGSQVYPDSSQPIGHIPSLETPAANSLEWNSYIMHGLGNTTPPTPESFKEIEQPHLASSENVAFRQSLEESEEEGEILVGMGLYDTPDKCEEDPQLDTYRSTVSSLLGSAYRPTEPTGKGLKLEETWEPPQSDDEEDEEDEASATSC